MPLLLTMLFLGLQSPTVLSVVPDTKSVWIDSLTQCESEGSTTVKVLDSDGFYSYGLAQFHLSTWLTYGKKFGATKDNIFDGELQKWLEICWTKVWRINGIPALSA